MEPSETELAAGSRCAPVGSWMLLAALADASLLLVRDETGSQLMEAKHAATMDSVAAIRQRAGWERMRMGHIDSHPA